MEIKSIEDKNIWENFLKAKEKTFLHSWQWGELQKSLGEEIFRIGLFESSHLSALALIIAIKAKRGNFLLIPHGPVLEKNTDKKLALEKIIDFSKQIAKEKKYTFLRIVPVFEDNLENEKLFKSFGFKNAPIHIHPETTWIIDISKSEEEIFANFRKVHRNLIRRSQKEGVEIEISQDLEYSVLSFYKLYLETAKRQKFVPFSKRYIENEFKSFQKENKISAFFAKHNGQLLASAFIIFYDNTAYYHQGASIHSKIPAPYLMQWQIIKEAKKRNCSFYNMWGVAPFKKQIYLSQLKAKGKINPTELFKKSHPWYGLSLFKTGFGGRAKFYLKTKDLVFKKSYFINYIVEKTRKIKRRY